MSDSTVAAYLADHPKMAGVLFTVMLFLTQAGSVAAAHGCSTPGP